MDAVEQGHWADELAAWAWLIVVVELDFLFWLGVVRAVEAVLA